MYTQFLKTNIYTMHGSLMIRFVPVLNVILRTRTVHLQDRALDKRDIVDKSKIISLTLQRKHML